MVEGLRGRPGEAQVRIGVRAALVAGRVQVEAQAEPGVVGGVLILGAAGFVCGVVFHVLCPFCWWRC